MTQNWQKSAKALEEELDRRDDPDRLVVVALENFDQLLASLFDKTLKEERFRKWLTRKNNRIMLLATATGTVDTDYDRPLFQAFQSVRLTPWTPDICVAYFERRRQFEKRPSLTAEQEAKARAISDFIGGTPRLAQILASVLDTEDAQTVLQTMDGLADRLAEYYRARMEDLSETAQGLLDALIRGGEPASQTELAKRVGATQSQIARLMQDLQRADILRGQKEPGGKAILYRVADRVFVHFYKVRYLNRDPDETPLAAILDFFEDVLFDGREAAGGVKICG